jgi:choice-of-anchor B domain-containing protein
MKIKQLLSAAAILLTAAVTAQPLNVTFRSNLPYPSQTLANICGYVDGAGNEYALVGAAQGMSIVDVTDPDSPVEVLQVPNVDDLWKEIKVYGDYAYVTTEGGGGLQIVNLGSLPNVAGVTYHHYTGDGSISGTLNTIHALHIDGNYCYLYGSNLFDGGAIALDLTDPWNPVFAGKFDALGYVHDGYVRNDTLYAGHIYTGIYSVVDFTNKAAPVLLATQSTPTNFTHNTWLSSDSRYLFTTDENDNSYLASYDLSDLGNIVEKDRHQTSPGSNSIVHNTHIINVGGNDYAVTSWYTDGFTIVDAGRPENLVQVGKYDTYAGSGPGFVGAWGVYPYLPSGTIVVSNIDEGLFVFTPTYTRACYLEGTVTDSVCGVTLNDVLISISSAGVTDNTDLAGEYKTGTAAAGSYTVSFSKSGYVTKVLTGVTMIAGAVNILNVQLAPFNTVNLQATTVSSSGSTAVSGVQVMIDNSANSYSFTSDASGNFGACNIVSANDYDINAAKWGYESFCMSNQTINSGSANPVYTLTPGYEDDFTFNLGWTASGTAATGTWERGMPIETTIGPLISNPGSDVSTDCSAFAYVTGNGGGSASNDDVDDGATILTSPTFDLTGYINPYISYSRWFFNGGGSGSPNDSLSVSITNGLTTVRLEGVTAADPLSIWQNKTFRVLDYLAPTANMKMIVTAVDNAPGHLVEAGFDKFAVAESGVGISEIASAEVLQAFPNPFTDELNISYSLDTELSEAIIQITDLRGRIVAQYPLTAAKATVQISPELNAGMYFARIINKGVSTKAIRLVKTGSK